MAQGQEKEKAQGRGKATMVSTARVGCRGPGYKGVREDYVVTEEQVVSGQSGIFRVP